MQIEPVANGLDSTWPHDSQESYDCQLSGVRRWRNVVLERKRWFFCVSLAIHSGIFKHIKSFSTSPIARQQYCVFVKYIVNADCAVESVIKLQIWYN